MIELNPLESYVEPMEFNWEEAKKNLSRIEHEKKETLEKKRLTLLNKAKSLVLQKLKDSSSQVYFVGSITQPHKFHEASDIDIVLKDYTGDRFSLWSELERELGCKVELILFENCSFKDHVLKEGLRVL